MEKVGGEDGNRDGVRVELGVLMLGCVSKY